jgi:mRNA interferase YafQ
MTSQFRRDFKRIKKRGHNLALLEDAPDGLREGGSIDARSRDHALTGSY